MEDENKQVKVIITFSQDRASVGIVQTDCDPVFFMKQGTQDEILDALPEYIAAAKEKWQTAQRYPKAQLPEPPPAPVVTTPRPAAAPEKPKLQTPMF